MKKFVLLIFIFSLSLLFLSFAFYWTSPANTITQDSLNEYTTTTTAADDDTLLKRHKTHPLCSGAYTPADNDVVIYYLFTVLEPERIQSHIAVEECLPLKTINKAQGDNSLAHSTPPLDISNTHTELPTLSEHTSFAKDSDKRLDNAFAPNWDPERKLYCVTRYSPLHTHHFESAKSDPVAHAEHVRYMFITDVRIHYVTMEPSLIKRNTHDMDFRLPPEYVSVYQGNISAPYGTDMPRIDFCWNATMQATIKKTTNKDHYFALTYTITNATTRFDQDHIEGSSNSAASSTSAVVDDDYRSIQATSTEHDAHADASGINDYVTRVAFIDIHGWENPPTRLKWRFHAPGACDFDGYDETIAKNAQSSPDMPHHKNERRVGLTHGFENAGFIEWTDLEFNRTRESYRISWVYREACNFSAWWYLLTIAVFFLVMSMLSCALCFLLTIAQNVFRNKDSRELKYYQLDNNMRKPAVPIVKAPVMEQLKL